MRTNVERFFEEGNGIKANPLLETLRSPTRGVHQTQVFERYHRRQDELDSAIGEMFVKGVSTARW